MDKAEILSWLREEDETRLWQLWQRADLVRKEHVGDAVHLRGLVEVSNHCSRPCHYCGIRGDRADLPRYRMTDQEILACAHEAARYGYGTLVMQSGEDPGIGSSWLAGIVRRVKAETGLAVTLSLGERSDRDLEEWREAGADRYLLRFETSDRALYDRVHPSTGRRRSDRIAMLRRLRDMGFQIGSGNLIGLPGQSYESLADDVLLFQEMDLDMIGVGPYVPHPQTPLGAAMAEGGQALTQEVPATDVMTCKVVALSRILCPDSNIPSTTALATVNKERGRELGLLRGANVVMPNLTPTHYRQQYEIYPGKASLRLTPREEHERVLYRLRLLGRRVGTGPGGRRPSTAPSAAEGPRGCP